MENEKLEKSIAQTEVTLAALREPALQLIQEGVESAYTSQAVRTAEGLQVTTVDEKSKAGRVMLVEGSTEAKRRTIDFDGIHFDVYLKGDYRITHIEGKQKRVEHDVFELSGSDLDAWMHRPDKFTSSLMRADAAGKAIQLYGPAISEIKMEGRNIVRDPNNQPVRLARPAEGDPNCGLENIANPGNKRMECNYIVRDSRGGAISYNETREKEPAGFYYRSVVRDMQGNVLGIVYQNFNLDANGDLTAVHTSARKPAKPKN